MTVSTSWYFASSGRSSSMMCRQLPQQLVQKSSSTQRPRSAASVSGAVGVEPGAGDEFGCAHADVGHIS